MPSIVSGPFTVSRTAAVRQAPGVSDVVLVNRDSGFAGLVTADRETAIPGSADRAITLFTDISRLAIAPASINPGELNIRLSGLVVGFVGGASKEGYRKLAHDLAQEISDRSGIVLHGERAIGISAAVARGAGRNGLEIVFAGQPENGSRKQKTKQPADAPDDQKKIVVSSVFAQLQLLTTIPSVVIAFPGKIDTMYGWMTTLFSTDITNKNGIWRPPLLFLHDDWRDLVHSLKIREVISDKLLAHTQFFAEAKQVVQALGAHGLFDGKPEKREK